MTYLMYTPGQCGGYHALTPEVILRMNLDDIIHFHSTLADLRKAEWEAREQAARAARGV